MLLEVPFKDQKNQPKRCMQNPNAKSNALSIPINVREAHVSEKPTSLKTLWNISILYEHSILRSQHHQ